MSQLLTSAEGLQELLRLASGDAPNCVNIGTIQSVIARVQHGLPLDAVAQQLGLDLFSYEPHEICVAAGKLLEQHEIMRNLLRSLATPRRGTWEEQQTVQEFADRVNEALSFEFLIDSPTFAAAPVYE